MTKTEVCITIDTEFDMNGALTFPGVREPLGASSVHRLIGKESHGLGFILDTLAAYDLKATFFIEVFNAAVFGDREMGDIVDLIKEHGHDLQLHAHPCWLYLAKQRQQQEPLEFYTDTFPEFHDNELRELIQHAKEVFTRIAGIPPLAFRTGGLQVHRELYPILNEMEIPLASNVGVGIYMPTEQELVLTSGIHQIAGVTELPVLSYSGIGRLSKGLTKCATLIGSSWHELKALLKQANSKAITPIVLLTHASEFSRDQGSPTSRTYVPNHRVQSSLKRLCRFLAENDERFTVVTFRERKDAWLTDVKPPMQSTLQPPLWCVAERIARNNILPRFGIS